MYAKHPLHDPSQRPLHIIVVGAGPSGIATLIRLKELSNVTFQCFEKNPEVGGTWYETRYPGAACDIASHAYQYTFEPKKDWTRHFAPAEEIGDYFISVAKKHGLHDLITFSSTIVGAQWAEDKDLWKVRVQHKSSGVNSDAPLVAEYEADLLINAGGILNNWSWPSIPGLHEFEGQLVHTAAWDRSIVLEEKNVAVIGSGASGIQVVPQLQPQSRKLDLYVRSPAYILPTVGFGVESSTYNETYSAEDIGRFCSDDAFYTTFRKRIEQQMNENFVASMKDSHEQKEGRKWAESMMRQAITSPDLQEKLIPSWELGCRRITPGLPYLKAVQQPNVDVIRTDITRITKSGIETSDGLEHPADVIVCATGFNTSFVRYEIVGKGGVSVAEMWREKWPEAYLGLCVAGLPNYFTLLGPNCPIANGSLIPCIESSVDYVVQVIRKMQKDQIKTFDVKKPVQDAFNRYTQDVHRDLVWTGSCNSWYKDSRTGRVTAVWPGSSIHFMEVIETPRWEDFNLSYTHDNPFWFMGNGVSQREANEEDLTFYLGQSAVPEATSPLQKSEDSKVVVKELEVREPPIVNGA